MFNCDEQKILLFERGGKLLIKDDALIKNQTKKTNLWYDELKICGSLKVCVHKQDLCLEDWKDGDTILTVKQRIYTEFKIHPNF